MKIQILIFIFLCLLSICYCEDISENETSESNQNHKENASFLKRIGLSVGYRGGLCSSGEDLRTNDPMFSKVPYGFKAIRGGIQYEILKGWQVELGGSYFHEILSNRASNIYEPHGPSEEPWIYINTFWDIKCGAIEFSIRKEVKNYQHIQFIQIGYSRHFAKAKDKELAYRWNHQTNRDDMKSVIVNYAGQGNGINFAIGAHWRITNYVHIVPVLKYHYGICQETSNDLQSPMIWDDPIDINLCGIIFEVNLEFGAK